MELNLQTFFFLLQNLQLLLNEYCSGYVPLICRQTIQIPSMWTNPFRQLSRHHQIQNIVKSVRRIEASSHPVIVEQQSFSKITRFESDDGGFNRRNRLSTRMKFGLPRRKNEGN